MNFQDTVKSCFSKYTEFKGRAPRSEYWYWSLFVTIVTLVSMLLDGILGTNFTIEDGLGGEISSGYGYIYLAAALGLMLPGLAVTVRRLHDTGRSGWFFLLALIPLVGGIILLIWFCTAGRSEDNQYGPNPLS
jgi:uncharacterized membrane protein YhaH (DUF805 family)